MTELKTKTNALIYKVFTTYMRIKYASRRIAVKVKEDVYSKGVYFRYLNKAGVHSYLSRLQNEEI